MRGSRRKDVATVKCGRDGGREHPGLIGDFVSCFKAIAIDDWCDQAIIRQYEVLAFFCFDDHGFSHRAYPRVNHGEKNSAGWIISGNRSEIARAFFDLEWCDLMRDVHNACLWCDLQYHGFAKSDGIIGCSEVRNENDGRTRRGRRSVARGSSLSTGNSKQRKCCKREDEGAAIHS